MSKFQHQIRPAPSGMNTEMDLPSLPNERAKYIKGFLPSRDGKLRLSHLLNDLVGLNNATRIIGHAWYGDNRIPTQAEYDSKTQRRSRLIVWYINGQIGVYNLFLGGRWPYGSVNLIQTMVDLDTDMERSYPPGGDEQWMNRHIRCVQLGDELLWCKSDGSRVRRMWQDAGGLMHMNWCGIQAMSDTTPLAQTVATYRLGGEMAVGTLNHAVPEYKFTFVDEKFRESDIGGTTLMYPDENNKPNVNNAIRFDLYSQSLPWNDDPQIKYIYVYRKAVGTTDWYRVTLHYRPDTLPDPGTSEYIFRGLHTFWDLTSEADLVIGTPAPETGNNAPPNQASIMAIHQNRLVLDDKTLGAYTIGTHTANWDDFDSCSRIQVSNLSTPTQFSVSGIPDANLGSQLNIGDYSGDEITGIYSLGEMLGVWKRKSRWVLYGSSLDDWKISYIDERGCVAPESIAMGDNAVFWLGDNGVYAVGYDSGFAETCVSHEIAGLFTGYASGSIYTDGTREE